MQAATEERSDDTTATEEETKAENERKVPAAFTCETCTLQFPNPQSRRIVRFCSRSCYKRPGTSYKRTPATIKKNSDAMRGMVFSASHKLKLVDAKKARPVRYWLGKTRQDMTRAKHWNWQGGITPKNLAIRSSAEYSRWRGHVFQRDDYTCQGCGVRGGKLHADHELPFCQFPDLRFEILNGRTLCVPCHRKTPTYGSKATRITL